MIVDGKKITVSKLDTKQNIEDKICLQRKILPKYINFKYLSENEIETQEINDVMKKYDILDFDNFLSKNVFELDIKTLIILWFINHKKDIDPHVEMVFYDKYKKRFDTGKITSKENIESFIKKDIVEFKNFSENITRSLDILTELEQYKATVISDIDIVKVKTKVNFHVNYDIFELFNSMELSRDIPFCVIGNYYKILKDFIPVDSWTYTKEKINNDIKGKDNVLFVKVLNVRNEPSRNITKTDESLYSTVSILFNPVEGKFENNKVTLLIESSVDSDFKTDDLISRIVNIFKGDIPRIEKKEDVQIKAELIVPNFRLDRPIFLDLILLNKIISNFCNVDERLRINKEKGGVYLYFSFNENDKDDDIITCSITEQVVEKTNQELMKRFKELKVNQPYMKLRITKVRNIETAEKFKYVFSRILTIYSNERDKIINEYEKYINKFEDVLKKLNNDIELKRRKSVRTRDMLKDVIPDQFTSGYSRWSCPAGREPKIIGTKDGEDVPEEVNDLRSKNVQVMLFPKENEVDYPKYYYSCHHNKNHKYPGLRINKLSNKQKYPIVPCCFKMDHLRKNSVLKEYYESDKINLSHFRDKKDDDDDVKNKRIFTTNKMLKPKQIGYLVKNINNYFATIDFEGSYYRKGVNIGPNSVIETILSVVDKNFEKYKQEELQKKIIKIREDIVKLVDDSDVFQSAYNYTPETLKNYLRDTNKYFNPNLLCRLLEEFFKCNLFIFTQNEKNQDGILDSVYFKKQYLSYKKEKKPYIFIYQHTGTDLDIKDYPHCELIYRVDNNNKKDIDYYFKQNYEVVKRTEEIFRKIYISDLKNIDIELKFKTKIISQGIDYNGKTRFLQFKNICLLSSPLPPLILKQEYNYSPIDIKIAEKFLKDEDVKIHTYKFSRNNIVGIRFYKDGFSFYIPIIPFVKEGGNKDGEIIYPTNIAESQLTLYNDYHKITRYLIEYMLYLFSVKYKLDSKNGEVTINDYYIEKFVKEYTRVDPSFEYGVVPRIFSMKSGVMKDNKLILTSNLALKKLVYILRVYIRNNLELVKKYSEFIYIQSYYDDIKDFSYSNNNPIIYGNNSLIKWIENNKPSYKIEDRIIVQKSLLLSELSNYDMSKLFIIIFVAKWHRPCKKLMKYIYENKRKEEKKKDDLFTSYSKYANFVYVDIDENRKLFSSYDVSVIPYVLFLKIQDNKMDEIDNIKCENIEEDVKNIEGKIIKILDLD